MERYMILGHFLPKVLQSNLPRILPYIIYYTGENATVITRKSFPLSCMILDNFYVFL